MSAHFYLFVPSVNPSGYEILITSTFHTSILLWKFTWLVISIDCEKYLSFNYQNFKRRGIW